MSVSIRPDPADTTVYNYVCQTWPSWPYSLSLCLSPSDLTLLTLQSIIMSVSIRPDPADPTVYMAVSIAIQANRASQDIYNPCLGERCQSKVKTRHDMLSANWHTWHWKERVLPVWQCLSLGPACSKLTSKLKSFKDGHKPLQQAEAVRERKWPASLAPAATETTLSLVIVFTCVARIWKCTIRKLYTCKCYPMPT